MADPSIVRRLALQAIAGLALERLELGDAVQLLVGAAASEDEIRRDMHALAGELLRRAERLRLGGADEDPHPLPLTPGGGSSDAS